ncbi:MAG: extracellular solute-binding protein [Clostridia bacterium]|nr:extracellular solute-binding protein [Clostridia bacterium]
MCRLRKTQSGRPYAAAKRGMLLAMLLAVLLTACACDVPSSLSPEPTQARENVTLEWYVNYSWFTTPWGGNLVSRAITERTGTDISFFVPSGNESDRLNALIFSDALPDLITLGWWEPQVRTLIDGGYVWALDDLAQLYDPTFFDVTDRWTVEWYRQSDGKIYGYPNSSYSIDDYREGRTKSNQTFLVRKDIYEAIGSPDMTTPEGFMNAVRKAAELFPTVNGEKLIPVGAHEFTEKGCDSFDEYLFNFLALPVVNEDGTLHDRYTDPEYIRWLKAFRQLGEEGYLLDDIFIDKRAQMEEKLSQGRYFCMIYQRTDIADQQKILYDNDPESIYIAVDGPKNSSGDAHRLPSGGLSGWTVTLISKKSKHLEQALAMMRYMISEEGQRMIWLGVEGVTYEVGENGVPHMLPEVKSLLNEDRTRFDELYGADVAYWMLQNNAMAAPWVGELDEPLGQMERWSAQYTVYTGQYDVQMDRGMEESQISDKVDAEWARTLPQLLLAASEEEFDRLLDAFVKKRADYGYERVVRQSEETIAKNIERLLEAYPDARDLLMP